MDYRPSSRSMIPNALQPKVFGVFSLALLLFLTAACVAPIRQTNSSHETGRVNLVTLLSTPDLEHIAGAQIVLTRGGLRREALLDVDQHTLAADFADLPVGDWEIQVLFYDDEGDPTHQAEGTVRIYSGKTVTAQLTAEPAEGVFDIVADISTFPYADQVDRVRITFHTGNVLSLSQSDDPHLFVGSRGLPPGDYDYSVSLYGESYLVRDRIDESPWESVRIHAGKTAYIHWEPQSGGVRIETERVGAPRPPQNARLEYEGGVPVVHWEPVDHAHLNGYRIYIRDDEMFPFELVEEVGAHVHSWVIDSSYTGRDGMIWLTITAILEDGRESYRSEILALSTE